MLTKNFYAHMMSRATHSVVPSVLVAYDGTVCDAGYYQQLTNETTFHELNIVRTSAKGSGVTIGAGTTPATADDYKLESIITSGFSFTYPNSAALSTDESGVSYSASYGITNTEDTPLVISEIGLTGYVFSGTDSSQRKYVLLDRTVLEEPITINRGETKQLTYTIRMNYPTA